jgi:hypothetical protein
VDRILFDPEDERIFQTLETFKHMFRDSKVHFMVHK